MGAISEIIGDLQRAAGAAERLMELLAMQSPITTPENPKTFSEHITGAIEFSDVAEIWQYYAHLSFSDSRTSFNNMLEEKLADIQQKVTDLHRSLSRN